MIQQVIDANLFPPVIHLLSHAEFTIRKEAAWAISNATNSGTPEQVEYLVSCGCIPPLCEILTVSDNKIVQVALEGLENILHASTNKQIENMRDCISPLCKLLTAADTEQRCLVVACRAVGALVRKLSSNEKIRAEFSLCLMKEFYFEHHCVEMLIVVKRLMPKKSGHRGIRDLMLEYLVGIPNVFRA